MLKISNKLSITLSLILSVVVICACCAGSVFLPGTVKALCDVHGEVDNVIPIIVDLGEPVVLVLSYVAVASVLSASVLLIWLLLRVRKGLVFTDRSVSLVRGVSWCCMLLCAAFVVIGLKFSVGFVVACLALFLGICLRVVKNVIAEAVDIKSENDLTV